MDRPSLQHVALMHWELWVSSLPSSRPGSGYLCSLSPQISWHSPQACGLHHGPMTRRKKTLGTLDASPASTAQIFLSKHLLTSVLLFSSAELGTMRSQSPRSPSVWAEPRQPPGCFAPSPAPTAPRPRAAIS